MKKFISIIFIITIIQLSYSQTTVQSIGDKTCECIQNSKEDTSYDEKLKKCLTTINVENEKLIKVKSYLEKNCEYHLTTNRFNKESLNSVTNLSCECIQKIDANLESKLDSIKNCITINIMGEQMLNSLKQVDLDSLSTKDKPSKVKLIIQTSTDSEIYKQVETSLLENCPYLSEYLMMNEDGRNLYSVSFNKKARNEYDKGIQLLKKLDYKNSIKYFKKAVKIDPKFAFAWDNLGICYRRTNQLKKAENAYEKSIKVDSLGITPVMNLGVVYEKLKKYDKAILNYKKLIKLEKDNPEGYYGLGRMFLLKKEYDLALKNIVIAYKIYSKLNSPYRADAIKVIKSVYITMKNENKLDEFKQIAKKYNIQINK